MPNSEPSIIKLNLNLPALERLLGTADGTTEVQAALQQQIVQEFARRHLLPIANAALMGPLVESIKKMMIQIAGDALDSDSQVAKQTLEQLRSDLAYKVQGMLYATIRRELDEAVKQLIEKQIIYVKDEIKRQVQTAITVNVQQEVKKGIAEQLAAAAELAKNTG